VHGQADGDRGDHKGKDGDNAVVSDQR